MPDTVAPKSLRKLAEKALVATRRWAQEYERTGRGYSEKKLHTIASDASAALYTSLDAQAQESAQQEEKLRGLVREWKWEAYAWAVGIDPAGAKLDKALMECAKELEGVLDGTAPTPAAEEEGRVPHGSVIPHGVYGSP